MNSFAPPAYTTAGQDPPPPLAAGAQFPYGSPAQQQTAGPIVYNMAAAQTTTSKRVYENYHGRQSIGVGVTMILAGVFCIIFNIVSMTVLPYVSILGYGIWSGVMFIFTGTFGVAAAKKKTLCKIIAFMVLCIISSVLCLILFILSVSAAATAHHHHLCNDYYFYRRAGGSDSDYPTREKSPGCSQVVVLEALLACLALIVTICTIWGSVLCCKAACCCATSGQVLLPVQYIPMQGNQQMVFYPMQQGQQGPNNGIIIGGEMPTASGGSYDNFQYNPLQYAQGPPIYNEQKVPL